MRLIYRTKQLMLLGGDYLSFLAGFWLSLLIRFFKVPDWPQIERHLGYFLALFIFWLLIIYINGIYDLSNLKSPKFFKHFIETALLSLLLGILFFYILGQNLISPKTILGLNVVFGFGISYLWRLIFNKFINTKALQANIAFIGFNAEINELAKLIENFPERGYKIQAIFDPETKVEQNKFAFISVYSNLNNLNQIIKQHKINLLIIEPHLRKNDQIIAQLYPLLFSDTKITDLTSFYEQLTGRIPPSTFSEAWFIEHLKDSDKFIFEKTKAIIDFSLGILLGGCFLILFPILSLAIKFTSPGPIFYSQSRVGKNGKIFKMLKFRTMYSLNQDGSAELNGAQFASKDDKRITKIGRWLRKTRLDELPQFINLLKMEISLIGPRPERPEIVQALLGEMPFFNLRLAVKPGLTGWAVINQNYTDTYESTLEKLQYDLYYIKNRSALLDLSILLKTINLIIRFKGQ